MKELKFTSIEITREKALEIAEELKSEDIGSIEISNCNIAHDAYQVLVDAIDKNKTVKKIFSQNSYKISGQVTAGNGQGNHIITKKPITDNDLNDLTKALNDADNLQIQDVKIFNCDISNKAMDVISENIQKSKTIGALFFDNPGLPEVEFTKLIEASKKNTSIINFAVSHYHLEGNKLFNDLMQENNNIIYYGNYSIASHYNKAKKIADHLFKNQNGPLVPDVFFYYEFEDRKAAIRELLKVEHKMSDAQIDELFKKTDQYYRNNIGKLQFTFPGLFPVISALRNEDIVQIDLDLAKEIFKNRGRSISSLKNAAGEDIPTKEWKDILSNYPGPIFLSNIDGNLQMSFGQNKLIIEGYKGPVDLYRTDMHPDLSRTILLDVMQEKKAKLIELGNDLIKALQDKNEDKQYEILAEIAKYGSYADNIEYMLLNHDIHLQSMLNKYNLMKNALKIIDKMTFDSTAAPNTNSPEKQFLEFSKENRKYFDEYIKSKIEKALIDKFTKFLDDNSANHTKINAFNTIYDCVKEYIQAPLAIIDKNGTVHNLLTEQYDHSSTLSSIIIQAHSRFNKPFSYNNVLEVALLKKSTLNNSLKNIEKNIKEFNQEQLYYALLKAIDMQSKKLQYSKNATIDINSESINLIKSIIEKIDLKYLNKSIESTVYPKDGFTDNIRKKYNLLEAVSELASNYIKHAKGSPEQKIGQEWAKLANAISKKGGTPSKRIFNPKNIDSTIKMFKTVSAGSKLNKLEKQNTKNQKKQETPEAPQTTPTQESNIPNIDFEKVSAIKGAMKLLGRSVKRKFSSPKPKKSGINIGGSDKISKG